MRKPPVNCQRIYLACVGVALATSASGCGKLAEVAATQQFVKMKSQALESFPKITTDIYESCMRQASYKFLNSPPNFPDADRKAAIKICESDGKTASESVKVAHELIINYISSLANLAKSEAVDYKPQVEGVSKSLKSLPGLSTDEAKKTVDAGTSIAIILANALASGYQKQQLKLAVLASDGPLQTIVLALAKAIDNYYVNVVLSNEQRQLDSFYTLPIGLVLAQPRPSSVDQYVLHSLNTSWQEKQAITRAKASVASSYLTLLKQISCEHSKLKDTFMNDATRNSERSNQFCPEEESPVRPAIGGNALNQRSNLERYQKVLASYATELDRLSRQTKKIYSMD